MTMPTFTVPLVQLLCSPESDYQNPTAEVKSDRVTAYGEYWDGVTHEVVQNTEHATFSGKTMAQLKAAIAGYGYTVTEGEEYVAGADADTLDVMVQTVCPTDVALMDGTDEILLVKGDILSLYPAGECYVQVTATEVTLHWHTEGDPVFAPESADLLFANHSVGDVVAFFEANIRYSTCIGCWDTNFDDDFNALPASCLFAVGPVSAIDCVLNGGMTAPEAANAWTGTGVYGLGGRTVTPSKVASSITNCSAGNVVAGITIGDVGGNYPTTATSQAAQLATDQAAVEAVKAHIERPADGGPATVLTTVIGTLNTSAIAAAAYATGEVDQLAADQAAVNAGKADIKSTRTILDVQGTLNMALYALISGVVAAVDVRNGTPRYTGGGNGSCQVPIAANTRKDIPVDAVLGSLVVSPRRSNKPLRFFGGI